MLNTPSKSAATITSGVSGESMKACAMVPASTSFHARFILCVVAH